MDTIFFHVHDVFKYQTYPDKRYSDRFTFLYHWQNVFRNIPIPFYRLHRHCKQAKPSNCNLRHYRSQCLHSPRPPKGVCAGIYSGYIQHKNVTYPFGGNAIVMLLDSDFGNVHTTSRHIIKHVFYPYIMYSETISGRRVENSLYHMMSYRLDYFLWQQVVSNESPDEDNENPVYSICHLTAGVMYVGNIRDSSGGIFLLHPKPACESKSAGILDYFLFLLMS